MARGWRGVVDRIERAATRLGRGKSGRCSIEGLRLHERALRAGARVEAAVTSRDLRESRDPRRLALLAALEASGCELHVVPDEVLGSLTGDRGLGGIVGLVRMPDPAVLAELCAQLEPRRIVLLAACDIEEPGNTGALVRTALAGGAVGFVAVGITDPWHPKAMRTSMGSIFKLPILAAASPAELTRELRAAGGLSYAAVSRDGLPLPRCEWGPAPLAILLGGEAAGLPPEVRESADGRVSIPMPPGIDSFSVNAAAAILLYEAVGRRQA